ncbi:MAG: imidazolonepropionase [Defluviitaleaceae bacterium]|nr:imidazolonepropionase [Defluviitaleaceae bacterium]
MLDLLIKNALIATPKGSKPVVGENVEIFKGTIGIEASKIAHIGSEAGEALEAKEVLDAGGRLVTPGLVDAHTHLVFGGFRQHEFSKKIEGVPYLDILKAGGGILSTVEATRAATEEELYEKAKGFLNEMKNYGTTTVEAKSGYGLDFETELKQLKVVKRLREDGFDLVSTFMGAHAVPKGVNSNDFIEEVISWLPKLKDYAEFVDVFCEDGAFNLEQSEKLLTAAKKEGFFIKIHADEINNLGGSSLAAKLGAASAEHLIEADKSDIEKMAKAGTVAMLLPATSFYLNKPYAKAKTMIESGQAVAIATDFNPGSSPNFNLQLAMNIACIKYRLTPKEVLTSATLNAACGINRGSSIGSIELGKNANVVIWDAYDLDFLFYAFGSNKVYKVIAANSF